MMSHTDYELPSYQSDDRNTFSWVIEDPQILYENSQDQFDSDVFKMGYKDLEWQLSLFPKGICPQNKGLCDISCSLLSMNKKWKCCISRISIRCIQTKIEYSTIYTFSNNNKTFICPPNTLLSKHIFSIIPSSIDIVLKQLQDFKQIVITKQTISTAYVHKTQSKNTALSKGLKKLHKIRRKQHKMMDSNCDIIDNIYNKMKQSHEKQQNPLTFIVNITVLRIILKQNNKILYQISVQSDYYIQRNQYIKWTLCYWKLKDMQNANVDSYFISDVYYGIWRLILYPAPNPSDRSRSYNITICLQLCALPKNSNGLYVRYRVYCSQYKRKSEWKNKYFSYENSISEHNVLCDKWTWKDLSTVIISTDIDIIDQYDMNCSIIQPTLDMWNKYIKQEEALMNNKWYNNNDISQTTINIILTYIRNIQNMLCSQFNIHIIPD
eukprot:303113_1